MSKDASTRGLPIALSIVAALLLTLAPLPDWAQPFRPDWVLLTLIYWSMNLPRTCGVGIAWIVGILLDVALGTLLAQHALALSLIIYLTVKFHLQIRVFPMSQMALSVFAMLALYRFVLFWINGIAGIDVPAVSYWGPVLTGGMLWPLIAALLQAIPLHRGSRA